MNRILFVSLMALLLGSCGLVRKKTSYGSGASVSVPAGDRDAGVSGRNEGSAGGSADGETRDAEADIYSENNAHTSEPDQVDAIIQTAMDYSGTRYRYGGTSRKGMDCSGLLYVAFNAHDFALPRVSHEMADQGRRIRVSKLQKGDLLFFKTSRRGKRINHVGLVVEVKEGDVRFIHATTSRGVIVSSLREGFWNYAFVKATRVF